LIRGIRYAPTTKKYESNVDIKEKYVGGLNIWKEKKKEKKTFLNQKIVFPA
jgi:hypothetical protein